MVCVPVLATDVEAVAACIKRRPKLRMLKLWVLPREPSGNRSAALSASNVPSCDSANVSKAEKEVSPKSRYV